MFKREKYLKALELEKQGKNYSQIGRALSVSRERARQLCCTGLTMLKTHPLTYEEERNRLIPLAEKYANTRHGEKAKTSKLYDKRKNNKILELYANKWNCAFHSKMDELYWKYENGKRGGGI